jgi:hypothetical protein
MKTRLNAKTASLTVLLYLVLSIVAAFFAVIFSGGIDAPRANRNVDEVIDSGMVAMMVVLVILLFMSLYVFNENRRDIFFERKRFNLSKLYYLFPLAELAVIAFVFLNVEFAAYSLSDIVLVLVATLVIGANEEIISRGILLIGLRNSRVAEWKAWLVTLAVFALMHLVNVIGGGSFTVLLVVLTGGTLWYVSRRVFNNLFVSIALHALYDAAFFLLTGKYLVDETLPSGVLDIQLGSFLFLFIVSVLFVVFGRGLLKDETTGWQQDAVGLENVAPEAGQAGQ